jgi:hypothetical protein
MNHSKTNEMKRKRERKAKETGEAADFASVPSPLTVDQVRHRPHLFVEMKIPSVFGR